MDNGTLQTVIGGAISILGLYIADSLRRKKKSEYIDTAFQMYKDALKRADERAGELEKTVIEQRLEIDRLKRGRR